MIKKAVYSDVDGTLATGFYIKELCDALYKEGKFLEKEYKTAKEIFRQYKSGFV